MSALNLPRISSFQDRMEEASKTSIVVLNPDWILVVSLELIDNEWWYVIHPWQGGGMSPDESTAAVKLCNAARQVAAGQKSVEDFIDTFYPEDDEHSYTRKDFFEKGVLKNVDGKLTMNLKFK
jgi:hypothetical protein